MGGGLPAARRPPARTRRSTARSGGWWWPSRTSCASGSARPSRSTSWSTSTGRAPTGRSSSRSAAARTTAALWDISIGADAAFYLYMREAADFAGGRARPSLSRPAAVLDLGLGAPRSRSSSGAPDRDRVGRHGDRHRAVARPVLGVDRAVGDRRVEPQAVALLAVVEGRLERARPAPPARRRAARGGAGAAARPLLGVSPSSGLVQRGPRRRPSSSSSSVGRGPGGLTSASRARSPARVDGSRLARLGRPAPPPARGSAGSTLLVGARRPARPPAGFEPRRGRPRAAGPKAGPPAVRARRPRRSRSCSRLNRSSCSIETSSLCAIQASVRPWRTQRRIWFSCERSDGCRRKVSCRLLVVCEAG